MEEYRRAYMQMEGVGNTPVNFVKRMQRFAESIKGIFSSADKDSTRYQEKVGKFRESIDNMRDRGVSGETLGHVVKNIPISMRSDTMDAISRTSNSALSLGKSLNEFGQTSASIIAGGHVRSNSYDGQDVENGIRFALTAKDYLNKGLRLPVNIAKGTRELACFGSISKNYIGDKVISRAEQVRDIQKTLQRETVFER